MNEKIIKYVRVNENKKVKGPGLNMKKKRENKDDGKDERMRPAEKKSEERRATEEKKKVGEDATSQE